MGSQRVGHDWATSLHCSWISVHGSTYLKVDFQNIKFIRPEKKLCGRDINMLYINGGRESKSVESFHFLYSLLLLTSLQHGLRFICGEMESIQSCFSLNWAKWYGHVEVYPTDCHYLGLLIENSRPGKSQLQSTEIQHCLWPRWGMCKCWIDGPHR